MHACSPQYVHYFYMLISIYRHTFVYVCAVSACALCYIVHISFHTHTHTFLNVMSLYDNSATCLKQKFTVILECLSHSLICSSFPEFGLSAVQAEALLSMTLRKLTGLEVRTVSRPSVKVCQVEKVLWIQKVLIYVFF